MCESSRTSQGTLSDVYPYLDRHNLHRCGDSPGVSSIHYFYMFRGLMGSQFLCHLCIPSNGVINDLTLLQLCVGEFVLEQFGDLNPKSGLIHQLFTTGIDYLGTLMSKLQTAFEI